MGGDGNGVASAAVQMDRGVAAVVRMAYTGVTGDGGSSGSSISISSARAAAPALELALALLRLGVDPVKVARDPELCWQMS